MSKIIERKNNSYKIKNFPGFSGVPVAKKSLYDVIYNNESYLD